MMAMQKDILAILKDHGFNWIRLRIFVNPAADGGYSKEGFCDLEHTLQVAKRSKRRAWGSCSTSTTATPGPIRGINGNQRRGPTSTGPSLRKPSTITREDVMTALKKQGTTPDMVQIGNEISNGFLWPDGKVWENKEWDAFCGLIQAGIDWCQGSRSFGEDHGASRLGWPECAVQGISG